MRFCSIWLFFLLGVANCDVVENELGTFPQNVLTEGSKTRESWTRLGRVCVSGEQLYRKVGVVCVSGVRLRGRA